MWAAHIYAQPVSADDAEMGKIKQFPYSNLSTILCSYVCVYFVVEFFVKIS